MATVAENDFPQSEQRSISATKRPTALHSLTAHQSHQEQTQDEADFWAQQEERAFGRLALEADCLFDRSITCELYSSGISIFA